MPSLGLEYAIGPVTCAFSDALAWLCGGVEFAGEATEDLFPRCRQGASLFDIVVELPEDHRALMPAGTA
jgi:hypothetical protein